VYLTIQDTLGENGRLFSKVRSMEISLIKMATPTVFRRLLSLGLPGTSCCGAKAKAPRHNLHHKALCAPRFSLCLLLVLPCLTFVIPLNYKGKWTKSARPWVKNSSAVWFGKAGEDEKYNCDLFLWDYWLPRELHTVRLIDECARAL